MTTSNDSSLYPLIVITRFGVNIADPSWFAYRLRLFEAITLPSLSAQWEAGCRWLIFVGPTPKSHVTDKLQALTADLDGVEIVRSAMTHHAVATQCRQMRDWSHVVTARIDDDDAWEVGTIRRVRRTAGEMVAAGIERCGFTFRNGYEWVIADLVDVDALNRGEKVVRRSAARCFQYDFHSMSCFTLQPTARPYDRTCGSHAKSKEDLSQRGYAVRVFENPGPAWLYVRHHQAISGLVKSRVEPMDVGLRDLAHIFGIDGMKVERIQANAAAASIPYARKRTRKLPDQTRLTFWVEHHASLGRES